MNNPPPTLEIGRRADRQQPEAEADVVQMLRNVQSLEDVKNKKSRFRRLCRKLEPLINFVMMYSPAVDMMVQFDAHPSALIWGSLKAILNIIQNSIRSYHLIAPTIERLADIFSVSSHYEKMFYQKPRVRLAVTKVYEGISLFLQQIERILRTSSIKIVMKSFLHSIDAGFESNIQCMNRTYLIFQEEATLAHRQHVENYIMDQKIINIEIHNKLHNGTNPVQSILAWLGPSDYEEPLRHMKLKRASNTGKWLLESPEFCHWLADHNQDHLSRVLWIHGAPGIGKSMLCTTALEHIQANFDKTKERGNSEPTIVYSHCGYGTQTRRKALDICSSLLLQLQQQHHEPLHALKTAYQNAVYHGRSRISDADDIFSLFRETASEFPSVYIVIDALDECTDIGIATDWLMSAVVGISSLRVLLFSRDTINIRRGLEHVRTLSLAAEDMKGDIASYLANAVRSLPCESRHTREHVSNVLSSKANGMFLYAVLGLETLQLATNMDETIRMLESTPKGVYDLYDLILKLLRKENCHRRSLVRKVLRILCTSTRPLTWSELRFALSWDTVQKVFDPIKEPFKETILTLCCPLIEYREEMDTFRLVHLSLHEFLCNEKELSRTHSEEAEFFVTSDFAQTELAEITLARLSNDEVSRSKIVDEDRLPLVDYATKNWSYHLTLSPPDADLFLLYSSFTACPERRSTWISRWLLSEDMSFPLQRIITLQNKTEEWLRKGNFTIVPSASSLADIQNALFHFDELQQSTPEPRVISNFEKLVCLRDLARELTANGQLSEGIRMFKNALLRTGTINVDSCWLLNSLGILYDQQGRVAFAKETQERALACQERYLPSDHFDTILTINELGRIARHMGNYVKAESLHRRVLAILEDRFDENDLHITWTKSALGRSLLKQGRPSEALPYHQQVLHVEVERLGKDHPHTLWTMSDIVRCLRDLGRLNCAISIQEEIVDRSGSVLGPKNLDTLWAMNSLGLLFEMAGNRTMAMNFQETAYKGQIEILGEIHPHCVWTRDVLQKLQDRQICA